MYLHGSRTILFYTLGKGNGDEIQKTEGGELTVTVVEEVVVKRQREDSVFNLLTRFGIIKTTNI